MTDKITIKFKMCIFSSIYNVVSLCKESKYYKIISYGSLI